MYLRKGELKIELKILSMIARYTTLQLKQIKEVTILSHTFPLSCDFEAFFLSLISMFLIPPFLGVFSIPLSFSYSKFILAAFFMILVSLKNQNSSSFYSKYLNK